MKIIDAFWEKRNIGFDVAEVRLENSDAEDLATTICQIEECKKNKEYIVAKLPVCEIGLLHALEEHGFQFMETQFDIVYKFNDIEYSKPIERLLKKTILKEVPKIKLEWKKIIDKITPSMFNTDRISVDPVLSSNIGCTRYKNWCLDLFEKNNTVMTILMLNEKIFHFQISMIDDGIETAILGGTFLEFQGFGFGILGVIKNHLLKNRKTTISSNNLSILKIYQQYGWIIENEYYVLRYVSDNLRNKGISNA